MSILVTTVSPSFIGEGYNTPKLRKEILYRILQLDDRSPIGVLQGSILDYVNSIVILFTL